MVCHHCNQEINKSDEFCQYCGQSQKRKINTSFTAARTELNPFNEKSPQQSLQRESKTEIYTPGKTVLNQTTIGRGSHNDIVLDYPIISREHALLKGPYNNLILEDRQSSNHTFVNDRNKPIESAKINDNDTIYFGSYKISAKRLIELKRKVDKGYADPKEISITKDINIIGRDPKADIRLDYPQISRQHAKLIRKSTTEYIIKDLSSTNGTFVNGQRIHSQNISVTDVITLGSFSFSLSKEMKILKHDLPDDIRIDADSISFVVKDKGGKQKKILDNISLTILPSEFVGLMGPAGAGKTTLMLAMNGYLPPTSGASVINGKSLYGNYDAFRGNIGYVPQDDIIHPELTVYEALYYTARLRLPSDTTKEEIDTLIVKNMTELGLIDKSRNLDIRNVIIGSPDNKGISGGQRKRVNLAMELLTAPNILFLDEPTSGLSSQDTLVVMDVLRKLADKGKTIVLTIHQPSMEAYKKMDNMIIVSSGKLMYYGPTFPDSLVFFNKEKSESDEILTSADYALKGLSEKPESFWENEYKQSEYSTQFVKARKDSQNPLPVQQETPLKTKRSFDFKQWWILTSRYFTIKKKDIVNTAMLLLQAPIIALLVAMVFYNVPHEYHPCTPLFLIVVSALWFGTSNSAREIVSERAIYRRERMVNLKIPSYLFSKIAVQSLLCLIQCIMLVGIIYYFLDFHGTFRHFLRVAFLSSLIGISIGLFISTVTKTEQQAVTIVPLVLIPMIIMGGGMIPVKAMNACSKYLSYLVPSRWSYEQILHAEDLGFDEKMRFFLRGDDYTKFMFGNHEQYDFVIILAILIFIALFIRLTVMVLRKRDIV